MGRIRLGSITLLFTLIILCVSVLAVLSVATANTDAKMTSKFAEETKLCYQLENEAQSKLAEISSAISKPDIKLPDYVVISGDLISFTAENDKKQISVTLRSNGDNSVTILSWKETALWSEEEELKLIK